MTKLFRTAAAAAARSDLAAPAMAQTLTGSITGTIKDEQGAVLPGVTVTLTGKQGAQTQVTEANGSYRFPALEVGTYEVSAELSGFSQGTQAESADLARPRADDRSADEGRRARGERHRRRRSPVVDVKSSATETTISQSLLSSAPITRTAINVINYAPGINSGSAYGGGAGLGQLAADRRRRHPRPERRHRLDLLQLQHRRGVPVPGARRAGRIRRLHRRGGQHHHQVGRQPLLAACSTTSAPTRASAATTSPATIAAQNPSLADPATHEEVRGHHHADRRADHSRTSCSSSSAPSASCSRPIRADR